MRRHDARTTYVRRIDTPRPGVATAHPMSARGWWRRGLKALHELSAIGVGGGLAACLVIDLAVPPEAAAFVGARQAIASIAHWLLVPSLAVVLVSGLLAIAATRGFHDAGWAWVKALLGIGIFEATLVTVGASREEGAIASAADPVALAAMLHSERATLWLLLVLGVANVALAVWRPKLTVTIR